MTTDLRAADAAWAYSYAELGAKHVLTVASGKLAGRLGRSARRHTDQHRALPPWDRHTAVPECAPDLDRLLADAFAALPEDITCLRGAIDGYVRDRIGRKQQHDPVALHRTITEHGCHGDA